MHEIARKKYCCRERQERVVTASGLSRVIDKGMLGVGPPARAIAEPFQPHAVSPAREDVRLAPGSPRENGYGESFIGRFRDEVLDLELFTSLLEAQVVTEDWRIEYNTLRPHGALDYSIPAEFATTGKQSVLALLKWAACS